MVMRVWTPRAGGWAQISSWQRPRSAVLGKSLTQQPALKISYTVLGTRPITQNVCVRSEAI